MSATYIPCPGTGKPATDARRITGAEGKFFRLNGRTYGKCPHCGKSANLADTRTTPRHKEGADRGM